MCSHAKKSGFNVFHKISVYVMYIIQLIYRYIILYVTTSIYM